MPSARPAYLRTYAHVRRTTPPYRRAISAVRRHLTAGPPAYDRTWYAALLPAPYVRTCPAVPHLCRTTDVRRISRRTTHLPSYDRRTSAARPAPHDTPPYNRVPCVSPQYLRTCPTVHLPLDLRRTTRLSLCGGPPPA
ncbi:hypothetical protein [Kribbella sp. NPDC049584]|uniref:hypothetical protein n=1 Tax=Kribbella sp. NPDC049584 TaxID=3154833 RepID=UPI003446F791